MLKVGGKAMQLLDVLGAETKAALMGQELKMKKSCVSVGFNAPQNPETVVSVGIELGGQGSLHKAQEYAGLYNDSVNHKKEAMYL